MTMTRSEAAALIEAAGLRLSAGQSLRLLELTEGWPAALYLAAKSVEGDRERRRLDRPVRR